MSNRNITAFTADTHWAAARHLDIAGDASSRRYQRLIADDGARAVLMIAPPTDHASTENFVAIGRHLTATGFTVPTVLKSEPENGLVLLEDLGDQLFSSCIAEDEAIEERLYAAAVDCLAEFQSSIPARGLQTTDADTLARATEVTQTWYAKHTQPYGDLTGTLRQALNVIPDLSAVMVHRDFHCENLIWLPERGGHKQVGLLDFQDALLGHRAYDLVSLLQDARRDLREGLEMAMIDRYLFATGIDRVRFLHDYALVGAQRHLRILGVFARLAKRDGKPEYMTHVPRVWGYLLRCLDQPGLENLKAVVLKRIPPPQNVSAEAADA